MVLIDKIRRPSALAVAVLLLFTSIVPLLSTQKVGAYGVLSARSIRMSSSASGTLTAGQDVTYEVNFTTTTAASMAGLVIDFCNNSPIIGDTCTAPPGLNTNIGTLTLGTQTGVTGWAKDTVNSTANKVVLTRTASAVGASVAVTVPLGTAAANDGLTNPTGANTTFYARIITYTTAAAAQAYSSATTNANNPGATPPVIDAGGVALSTAAQITITAKVQERLTFCVYTDGNGDLTLGDANTANCTGVTGSAVTLGDSNGVLTDSGPYVNTHAMFNISTNAQNGATVRAKGSTLTSGVNTINAIGGGTVEAGSTPGTEQFGFCAFQANGTGLVIDSVYDGFNAPAGTNTCSAATHTSGGAPGGTGVDVQFAFVTADLSSVYGDTIATKPAGLQSTGRLAFLGNIAVTTEPGIYTSVLNFIATGNY